MNREDHPPRSGNDHLTERALDELGDRCEIPAELEEQILARVLGGEAPVVKIPEAEPGPEPLRNLIRLGREEDRRWVRIGWAMAAAAVLLLSVVALAPRGAPSRSASVQPTSLYMRSAPPAGMHGTEVADSHPRLVEAREVMFVVAENVSRQCPVASWSTVVRFEHTGQATVLDVSSSEAAAKPCVEQAVAGARIRPSSGPRLAVRFEQGEGALRGEGAAPARVTGWLVDET